MILQLVTVLEFRLMFCTKNDDLLSRPIGRIAPSKSDQAGRGPSRVGKEDSFQAKRT